MFSSTSEAAVVTTALTVSMTGLAVLLATYAVRARRATAACPLPGPSAAWTQAAAWVAGLPVYAWAAFHVFRLLLLHLQNELLPVFLHKADRTPPLALLATAVFFYVCVAVACVIDTKIQVDDEAALRSITSA